MSSSLPGENFDHFESRSTFAAIAKPWSRPSFFCCCSLRCAWLSISATSVTITVRPATRSFQVSSTKPSTCLTIEIIFGSLVNHDYLTLLPFSAQQKFAWCISPFSEKRINSGTVRGSTILLKGFEGAKTQFSTKPENRWKSCGFRRWMSSARFVHIPSLDTSIQIVHIDSHADSSYR